MSEEQKPLALRLASQYENGSQSNEPGAETWCDPVVAAELRRLHAEVEQIRDEMVRCKGAMAVAMADALDAGAKVERLRAELAERQAGRDAGLKWQEAVHAAVVKQVAEIEALRPDAARYRWLRDNTGDQIPCRGWWQIAGGAGADKAGLDAAIDAEIERAAGREG